MTDLLTYGIMAEFETAEQLLEAAAQHQLLPVTSASRRIRPCRCMDSPRVIGVKRTAVARIVLAGGILGCIGGYGLQYYMTVISYAHNVGGRPVHSWPAYIPVTFETTVLCAALSAVFGMLALNKLPMPYHPAFNVPDFKRAIPGSLLLVHPIGGPSVRSCSDSRVSWRAGRPGGDRCRAREGWSVLLLCRRYVRLPPGHA